MAAAMTTATERATTTTTASDAGQLRPPPPPGRSRRHRLPSVVLDAIYTHLPPADAYKLAALHRHAAAQAEAMTQLPWAGMNSCRNVAILEFRRQHTAPARLATAYTWLAMAAWDPAVLSWWAASGLELRLDDDHPVLDRLCYDDAVPALDWWKASGLPLRYTKAAVEDASRNRQLRALQWWRDSGLQLLYTSVAVETASARGHLDVLRWWRDSGLEVRYEVYAMDKASANGRVEVLQWWAAESGLPLLYSDGATYYASSRGQLGALRWWAESGLELRWRKDAFVVADSVEVLDWWRVVGVFDKWLADAPPAEVRTAKATAQRDGKEDVVRWWDEHCVV